MKLCITTQNCLSSGGFISSNNPVVLAFQRDNPDFENVTSSSGNRLTAWKGGFPVKFQIKDFTVEVYRQLMHNEKESHICELVAVPIRLTSNVCWQ